MARFTTARFHVEIGPASLFERVRFKMSSVTGLILHSVHFVERARERHIPEEVLDACSSFDTHEWELVTAEVRTDKGKFVCSTWMRNFNDKQYCVVIGFNSCPKTIYEKTSSGFDKIIRRGELFEFVSKVNRGLMDAENIGAGDLGLG